MNPRAIVGVLMVLSVVLLGRDSLAAGASGEPNGTIPRPVSTWLEAQVELHRRGFSCGGIDGIAGPLTRAALIAWQESQGLRDSGQLDTATRNLLQLSAPATAIRVIRDEDLRNLRPVPATWLEKSEQPDLPHENLLERIAERYHATQRSIQRLNPGVDWQTVQAGQAVVVPNVERVDLWEVATRLVIRLQAHELRVFDSRGALIARFPISIGRTFEMRPVGELRVTTVAENPNYTFDPEVFPESAEGARLGRRLLIPPGPNNPVGVAWIGLDRPGYGIHGTPIPENIGKTESHGCFRLANWDALTVLDLAWVGMPVTIVE